MLPDMILILYMPPHCVIDIGRKEQVFPLAGTGFLLATEVVLLSNWPRKLLSVSTLVLHKRHFHISSIEFSSHC